MLTQATTTTMSGIINCCNTLWSISLKCVHRLYVISNKSDFFIFSLSFHCWLARSCKKLFHSFRFFANRSTGTLGEWMKKEKEKIFVYNKQRISITSSCADADKSFDVVWCWFSSSLKRGKSKWKTRNFTEESQTNFN